MKKIISLNLLAIALLSACQTTSLRDVDKDPVNQAEYELQKNKPPEYQAPQQNQLRMFVFTEYESKKLTENNRDGYYIDFTVKQAEQNEQASEPSQ